MGTGASVETATSIRNRLEVEVGDGSSLTDEQTAELQALYTAQLAQLAGQGNPNANSAATSTPTLTTATDKTAYEVVKEKYAAFVATEKKLTNLRALPDAIDSAVFVDGKWPLIVDPSGQAARFLQYQNGAFIVASIPAAVEAEVLRARLVSCLQHGRSMILSFGNNTADLQGLFHDGLFPAVSWFLFL